MKFTNAGFAGWVAALAVVGGVAEVGRAGERAILPDGIQLRVSVSDQLGNPVTQDTFVKGEVVLIHATLSDLGALQARANQDRSTVQRLRLAGSLREEEEIRRAAARAEVEQGRAIEGLLPSSLQRMAGKLVLTARRFEQGRGGAALTPTPLEADATIQSSRQSVRDRTEVWWKLDSAALLPGPILLQLASGAHVGAASASMRFELVSPEQASPENRCRSIYVRARLAMEAKPPRHDEAARLAEDAAQFGLPNGYYRMAALHTLGDAQSALGNRQAAIAAYRQALDIVNAAFPKSRLPYILSARIRDLEAEVD